MFEYAWSESEGTLLGYGVAHATVLASIMRHDGDAQVFDYGTGRRLVFRAASPDCVTGQ